MLQRYLFLTLFSLLSIAANAQDKSNRGKEFWLAYGFDYSFLPNDDPGPNNNQELALYISTEQAATVTVSISNTGFSQTLNIPANSVDASILIPKTGANDARTLTDGLQNRGIHIESDVPVAVYAHVYANQTSGATMLMPVETNGYLYHSINYYQTGSPNSPTNWYSWFYAIASEDNTRLEITPSDTTKNGWLPGQTYTVNLNKGESYHVFGKAVFNVTPLYERSKDMTGSKIVSVVGGDGNCHPVAVFSGSGGIRLCPGDGGEFMHQQVFPAQAWGTRYLTYHTINNSNTDILETNRNYYRVCVADPTTVVKKNGVVMTGLIKSFYYEYMDSTGGQYIEADKPILVSQYMVNKNQCWNSVGSHQGDPPSYGDPEMFYLSPIEQGQKAVRFYVSRKSTIDYVYTNIIFPTVAAGSLKVDGAAVPAAKIIPHPNFPSYSVALTRFVGIAAQHTITCDSTFNATVYGLGNFESYGYNVGTLINNLNAYGAIKNTFNTSGSIDTFTCPKTPVRLFAKVGYPITSITWKLSQVSGIAPNADSVIGNPVPVNTELINGRTYYVYTLQQDFIFNAAGTYTIPVSYTSTVIANCSQTESTTIQVVVKPGPVADFTIPAACPGQTIVLTGASSAPGFNITRYLWDFPDMTTQTTVDATKSFATVGPYNVRYRIYADNGCAGDTTKVVNIGSPLSLSIQGAGKACADSVFTFTSSIPVNASNPPTWHWDFGDGQTTSITNSNTVTHTYTAAAARTLKHSVSFTTGCATDTVTFSVPLINPNPSASFTYVSDTLCQNIPVKFESLLTGVSNWLWDFGNGSSNVAPPLFHTFNNGGTYNVSLTIKDINGCGSLAAINPVIINAAPLINAGPDKFTGIGVPVTIDASIANATNYDFVWTPSTYLNSNVVLNPMSTPAAKITYTIRATDKLKFCQASDSVVITPITTIYVPTAFTPNGDGKNDLFKILGTEAVTVFNLTIFNRYGQVVFQTSDKSKGWDGTIKGKPAIPGGYVYHLRYTVVNYPDPQNMQGSFILLR